MKAQKLFYWHQADDGLLHTNPFYSNLCRKTEINYVSGISLYYRFYIFLVECWYWSQNIFASNDFIFVLVWYIQKQFLNAHEICIWCSMHNLENLSKPIFIIHFLNIHSICENASMSYRVQRMIFDIGKIETFFLSNTHLS